MDAQEDAIVPPKKFPQCIVWTPIPLISWLLPFIGHMGVCTSKGIILDFAGPYYISVDNFAFGNPSRYVRLDPAKAAAFSDAPADPEHTGAATRASRYSHWDEALQVSGRAYQEVDYNFMTDNCHCFVAHFMNEIAYCSSRDWNMIRLAVLVFLYGRYASLWGFVKTWLPFLVIMSVGLAFGTWYFALGWACGLFLPMLLWFFIYSHILRKKQPCSPQPSSSEASTPQR